MTEIHENSPPAPVPKWYWVVGILSFIWAAFGLIDCYMSLSLNQDYLVAYPGYLDFILFMPLSVKLAWALATIGSTLGTVFLLLRRKWAVLCFGLAILGMGVSFAYQLLSPTRPDLNLGTSLMSFVIVVIGLAWFYFSRRWSQKDWLR